jgi:hypothetical protein
MQKSLRLAIAGLLFLSGITAASIQQNWHRLESAHFTVYTAGEVSDAVNALEQLEAVRAFIQSSLNVGRIPNFEISVVVFDGRQDFSRYEPHPNTFAFYRRHGTHNYIVAKSMHGGPARALAHEYIHAVFANITPKLPLWLAEGLAEVYSEAHNDGHTMSFGLAIPDHIVRLKSMPPGTVKTIFAARAVSVYADPSRVWDFYALSWSAVHTLVAEPKYSGKLADFVLATNETGTKDALRAVYGVSTAEFASDVEVHIKRASWEPLGRAFSCRPRLPISIAFVPESDVIAVLADIVRVDIITRARIEACR